MQIAICSATPYQTLNAINLAVNIIDNNSSKDLYYRNYNEKTNRILDVLKGYHLFDHIYEYDLENKNNLVKYYWNDFIQATSPKRFINGLTKSKGILEEKNYDFITITSGTELEVALTRIFTTAKTIAYDDGLGSYVGDIVHDHVLNVIWRILGRRTDKIWPIAMYVNNVKFCDSLLSENIIPFQKMSELGAMYNHMIYDIFGYTVKDSPYGSGKLVYLTQPHRELGKQIIKDIMNIENIISNYSKECIVRKHPRDHSTTINSLKLDDSEVLWELICETEISDNHVLIGICSSAQIMPKLLYDKEPWLVFTYNILKGLDHDIQKKRFDPIVNKIRDLYIDKGKIVLPKTSKELKEFIDERLKKND